MNKKNCAASAKLMSEALAGGDDLKKRRLDKHLSACDECRAEFAALRETWDMIAPPPPAQNAPVQLRLHEALRPSAARELLDRAVTAAIAAAIIFILLMPFLLPRLKQPGGLQHFQSAIHTANAVQTPLAPRAMP